MYSDSVPIQSCSDSVPIQSCSDSVPIQSCSDSVPIQSCSDSVPIRSCSDSTLPLSGALGTRHLGERLHSTVHEKSLWVATQWYQMLYPQCV